MEKITTIEQLELEILTLEINQEKELIAIKEKLKISSFIRTKVNELLHSEELKENALDAALSLGAGALVKKLVVGSSHNLTRQLIGSILKMAVTTYVLKNSDQIKSKGMNLISNLMTKVNKSV